MLNGSLMILTKTALLSLLLNLIAFFYLHNLSSTNSFIN